MKQFSVQWLILLLIVIPGFVCVDLVVAAGEIPSSGAKLIPLTGESVEVEGFTKHPVPTHDFSGYAIRVNPVSSSGLSFVHVKQVPPIWGRVLIIKQLITTSGFFFAAMVILLFFVFYQNSRTGSEGDLSVIADFKISDCGL